MAVSKQISPRLLKLLNKKYPSNRNFTVDDARKIQKSLGGTRVPVYSKDGGYIVKKRKKTVKKRKK